MARGIAALASARAQEAGRPALPQLRTRCSLRGLELLSVRQVQDKHALAPGVMRMRARLVQVLPKDPRLWTCAASPAEGGGEPEGAPARFSYRMVLQLEDVEAKQAWLGALLLDEQAEAFFPGMPAADLRRDAPSLRRLRAAVSRLRERSALLELGLVSYRPDPHDASETGVAYRVVSTTVCAGVANE